jgi:hypothetical protein
MNVTMNNDSGQTHQGVVDAGVAGAAADACASPFSGVAAADGGTGAASCDANAALAGKNAAAMINIRIMALE